VSFDLVAPHYRWLETIVFGNALQRARTHWIDKIPRPNRTLIVGEGNGRFLCQLLQVHPGIEVDCIDASRKMLHLAQRRVRQTCPESLSRVRFFCKDILQWSPSASYDLLVTHFFLDCFSRHQLTALIRKLAESARPGALWLIADFSVPREKIARAQARLLLRLMYAFFRAIAGIAASELADPTACLNENGFSRVLEKLSRASFIRSDLYLLNAAGVGAHR